MKTVTWAVCVAVAVGTAGCPKSGTSTEDAGAVATASASVTASADASADAGVTAAAKDETFLGKYSVVAAPMYVPSEKDWSSVKFKNDDAKHLGDGEMTLTIDAAGRVTGSTEGGALGATIITGHADGSAVTATILRKDPNDEGLTGTLIGKRDGDKIEGTLKLAEFNAAVVREAKISFTRK